MIPARVIVDGGCGRWSASASSPPTFQANCARDRSRAKISISTSPAAIEGSLTEVFRAVSLVMARMVISIPDVLLPDHRGFWGRGRRAGDTVKPDESPTARALLALELIQDSPGVTADRLRHVIRPDDTAARIGGDEFSLVLRHLPTGWDSSPFLRRLADSLAQPVHVHGRIITPSASIGVAVADPHALPDGERNPDLLLTAADRSMYHDKTTRRIRRHITPTGG